MAILVEISVTGGAYQSGGVTVADTATIQPRLAPNTSAGVTSVRWEIYEYPPGASTPSGWTADAGAQSFYFVATTATSLLPPVIALTGQPWGKWLLRATANNGVLGGVVNLAATRDELTAWSVESPGGTEDLCALEGVQFNPRGPLGVIREALRGPMFVYATAADQLRAAYDYPLPTTAVAASAGEQWVTIDDWLRTELNPVDGEIVTLTTELTVTDGVETPRRRDIVSCVATYMRWDAADETMCNADDEVSSTEAYPRATWALVLPNAAAGDVARGLIEVRWIRGILGDLTRYSLQVREHATSNRVIRGAVYVGTPR